MVYRSSLNCNKTKLLKIKTSTKVWKVQIKLPCGFYLKKNNENIDTIKWSIWHILN